MRQFREVMEESNLFDMGYQGYPYTFSNKRMGKIDFFFNNVRNKRKPFRFEPMWLRSNDFRD